MAVCEGRCKTPQRRQASHRCQGIEPAVGRRAVLYRNGSANEVLKVSLIRKLIDRVIVHASIHCPRAGHFVLALRCVCINRLADSFHRSRVRETSPIVFVRFGERVAFSTGCKRIFCVEINPYSIALVEPLQSHGNTTHIVKPVAAFGCLSLSSKSFTRILHHILRRKRTTQAEGGNARRISVLILQRLMQLEHEKTGAGEGNRTLVLSLGSSCSTIELHPHANRR